MTVDRAPQLREILANASSLAGTTLTTALLGFAFWALAARLFPPDVVGYASAAISAMVLLGTVGTLGLGTALIGEIAERSPRRGALVAAALCASTAGSALLAAGFLLVATLVMHAAPISVGVETVALFIIGVALTGATFVLDAACVGVLCGGLQLQRNIAFSIAKLAVLFVVGITARAWGAGGVLGAWVAGGVFSLLLVAVMLRARHTPVLHTPEPAFVRKVLRAAAPHNWLNLALEAPHLVPPILATSLVSATAGASFYAAWTIMSFLYIVPFHLGTVLYATGSARPNLVPRQLRFTVRLSLLVGLVGIPGLLVAGPWVLSLFGPSYHDLGTVPLRMLTLGYVPMVVVAHFVALCRVRRQIVHAACVLSVGGAIELGAAAAGALSGGLIGLSLGIVAGKWVQGALMVRTVFQAKTVESAEPKTQATSREEP